jgi:RNase adaptor protein for sRNA GlmZ degradation
MIVQGLMRSINEYSKLYAHQNGEIDRGNLQPTKDNMKMILNFAFSTNNAIMQNVLGVIKSFGVKKDIPIDAQDFIYSGKDIHTPVVGAGERPKTDAMVTNGNRGA